MPKGTLARSDRGNVKRFFSQYILNLKENKIKTIEKFDPNFADRDVNLINEMQELGNSIIESTIK